MTPDTWTPDQESRLRECLGQDGYSDGRAGAMLGKTKHQVRHKRLRMAVADGRLPVVISPQRTAEGFAERICASWRQSVEGIIQTGLWIRQAKDDLDHGEFGRMIEELLPFGASTAQRLMAIANDPKLTNPAHGQHLPASWRTLYELTKVEEAVFTEKIADQTICADMERADACALIRLSGSRAVAPSRREPDDSLDFFPTPPWATRALLTHVLCGQLLVPPGLSVWEPACGQGHMSEVLREHFPHVYATDIFDYGTHYQERLCDFLGDDYAPSVKPGRFDWIITNPPFNGRTLPFIQRALEYAKTGVAMFVRSQWAVEGVERYETLFRDRPPTLCAFFTERVNLCKGRWNPDGSTMTAYCWLVWVKDRAPLPPFWIPPGCRDQLARADDRERFACFTCNNSETPDSEQTTTNSPDTESSSEGFSPPPVANPGTPSFVGEAQRTLAAAKTDE